MEQYIDIAKCAVEKLKAVGAEKAECSLEYENVQEINYECGQFSLLRTYSQASLKLKALADGRVATSQIGDFSEKSIDYAVQCCMNTLKIADQDPFEDIAESQTNYVDIPQISEPDMQKFIERLVEFDADIKKEYPLAFLEMCALYSRKRSVYVNTNGVTHCYDRGHYKVFPGFTGREGEETTSFGCGSQLILTNLDNRIIDCGDVRGQLQTAIDLLHPKAINEKFIGPVVFNEAMAHYLVNTLLNINAGKHLISGAARWKNKVGEKVVDSRISVGSLVSDPRILDIDPFTADGYKSEDCWMIENGILKQLPVDRYTAAKTGMKRAGNDHAINIMRGGEDSLESLVNNIDHGILVGRISGADIGCDGNIRGVAKNAFYIKNGHVVHPLRETMISGNLFEMFNSVRGISREQKNDGFSIIPRITVDNMVISIK